MSALQRQRGMRPSFSGSSELDAGLRQEAKDQTLGVLDQPRTSRQLPAAQSSNDLHITTIERSHRAPVTMTLSQRTCPRNCARRCHKYTMIRSSNLLSSVLGSLSMGFHASPWLNESCDLKMCRSSTRRYECTYRFSRWLWHHVIALRYSNVTSQGPDFVLRIMNVREPDAYIFQFAWYASDSNAVDQVKQYLDSGKASIHDVQPDGSTLLMVSKLRCYVRSLNLTIVFAACSSTSLLLVSLIAF